MAKQSYYLGLDSGGSKTEVVILGADGARRAGLVGEAIRLAARRATPANLLVARKLIDAALAQARLTRQEIAFFGFGMCGADFDDEIPTQKKSLCRGLDIDPARAALVNDGVVALWGGSAAERAAILQLGTAFTAAYRRGLGTETPFDHLNAGIVIDVRRRILAACARVWDGRLPPSILPDLARRHFGVADPVDLARRATRNTLDRWKVRTVIQPWREAIERGDRVARQIADDAAEVYAGDLRYLLKKIGGRDADVVMGGGLLLNGPRYFYDRIASLVRRRYPQTSIHLPVHSPGTGAAIMAAFYDGREAGKLFRRVRRIGPPNAE